MNNSCELRKLLMQIGISANLKGFNYIIEAIDLLRKQQIHTSLSTIYNYLAEKNYTFVCRVERDIRTAIGNSYRNSETMKRLYPKKPNNSQFLFDLAFNIDIFINEIKEKVGN